MPYQEPGNELSDDVRDMHRAIESLKEELEAIDWYNQRVGVCKDKELRSILAHSRYPRAMPVGIYPASKASVEGEAPFGFADGGGDASPWNRDEEKEHASMILEWIRRKDSSFSKELKDHLFTEKPIAHE